ASGIEHTHGGRRGQVVARGNRVMASDQRRSPGYGCCFFVAHVRFSSKPVPITETGTILRPTHMPPSAMSISPLPCSYGYRTRRSPDSRQSAHNHATDTISQAYLITG